MNIPFEFPSDEARNKWLLYHFLKKTFTDVGMSDKDAEIKTEEMRPTCLQKTFQGTHVSFFSEILLYSLSQP